MKNILVLSILFSAIALPALGELTEADLNQIRLIVREEIKKETATINTKIDGLDTRLRTVETDVATIKGYQTGQKTGTETNISWIIAVVAVVGLLVSILSSFVPMLFKKETPLEHILTQMVMLLTESRSREKTSSTTEAASENTDTASVSP